MNRPLDRQTSGSRYRPPCWLGGEGPGEIGTGEEAGNGDVATEELVRDGQHPDLVEAVAVEKVVAARVSRSRR